LALEGLIAFGAVTSEFGIGDIILLVVGVYVIMQSPSLPSGLSSTTSSQLSDNVISNNSYKKPPNKKKDPTPYFIPLVPMSEILKPSNQHLIIIGTIANSPYSRTLGYWRKYL